MKKILSILLVFSLLFAVGCNIVPDFGEDKKNPIADELQEGLVFGFFPTMVTG